MAKIKHFDEKAQKNRARVRKCRQLKKIRLSHESHVRDRMFSKTVDFFNEQLASDHHENSHTNSETFDDLSDMSEFQRKLKCWAINHRISAKAISELLQILIFAGFSFLPKDSRTFMQTPCDVQIQDLSNGSMWYNGVEKCIRNVLSNISRSISLTIDFFFDGVPVFKSSNLQFWPILMAIEGNCFNINRIGEPFFKISMNVKEFPEIPPMTIAIWCGNSKPLMNEYLLAYVNELMPILSNGLEINTYHIKVKFGRIISDTPARALVKGSFNYNKID